MSLFTGRSDPAFVDHVERLHRRAAGKLNWLEKLLAPLNPVTPLAAKRCLTFLPEVHALAREGNFFAALEIYLCYGRWETAVVILTKALDGTYSDFPLAVEDRPAASLLLIRMKGN